MTRFLVLLVALTGAAAVARWLVYGSGSLLSASPLKGYVLLSAFAGGMALAFSRPFLLVLVPYLTILFKDLKKESATAFGRKISWGPPGWYLGAFAFAFVVMIGGFPGAVAIPIYRSEWLVDPTGGALLLVWGVLVALGLTSLPAYSGPSIWKRVWGSGSAGLLGATTGVLVYHELDPAYDSVFFFTANAGAASHAPMTVAVFTVAMGLTYLGAGTLLAAAMAMWPRWAPRGHFWGRTLSGFATALIGLAILTGRFGLVRDLLF